MSFVEVVLVAATPLPKWQVTLTDGSQLVVHPQACSLQLDSEALGAKLTIPISAIRSVAPDGDRGISVKLGNGDRISGKLVGPALKAGTRFGEIMIRPELIRSIEPSSVAADDRDADPPGEFQLDYAGLRWDLWRTAWSVHDGKLASQRRVRPGFRYGHWGNGRGGMVITGNGDRDWTDYELAFDYKMLPANREFFHAHIPGESRGMTVVFRAAEVTESWNQPDTCYLLGIGASGSWSLVGKNGWHMPGNGWDASKFTGKRVKLAGGKSKRCDNPTEGRLRLRVRGQTITAWLDDEQLFEFTHDGGQLEPIPYGGFGIQWSFESMGEISNLKVKRNLSSPES